MELFGRLSRRQPSDCYLSRNLPLSVFAVPADTLCAATSCRGEVSGGSSWVSRDSTDSGRWMQLCWSGWLKYG